MDRKPGQSLQPAPITRTWRPIVRRANEAKAALFLTIFIEEWEAWDIIYQIKQKAYFQRYEGEWKQVQEILEQDTSLLSIEEKIRLFVNTEDEFFGNFLVLCERFLKKNLKRFKDSDERRKKPRKPVYRRGYKDKGLRRPDHQKGRIFGDPDPGEDFRGKVKYGSPPY